MFVSIFGGKIWPVDNVGGEEELVWNSDDVLTMSPWKKKKSKNWWHAKIITIHCNKITSRWAMESEWDRVSEVEKLWLQSQIILTDHMITIFPHKKTLSHIQS